MTVFLATLGQRPQAITMALDVVQSRYSIDEVVILHTNPEASGISDAFASLLAVFETDYPGLRRYYEEIMLPDGGPLLDIVNQYCAEAYYRGVMSILQYYHDRGAPMHLLIAGGRKSMSVYAALAAQVWFTNYDFLWTIHAPAEVIATGRFHAPIGRQEEIELIQLPINSARLQATSSLTNNQRDQFFASLTTQQARLVQALQADPYASNEELGKILQKAEKTVENQLRTVYSKMLEHIPMEVSDVHKRQALLDILEGRRS